MNINNKIYGYKDYIDFFISFVLSNVVQNS